MTCQDKRPVFSHKAPFPGLPLVIPIVTPTVASILAPLATIISLALSGTLSAQEFNHILVPDVAEESWRSLQDLNPEQQALVAEACCGVYIDAELPPAITDGSLILQAGSSELEADSDQLIIQNGIDIRFEDIWIEADSGLYDQLQAVIELNGNIRLRRPGLLIGANSAIINQSQSSAALQNTSYVLHQQAARGTANSINFSNAEGLMTINGGSYTVCEPGDNSWLLAGEKIELDQLSGRGVGRNVTLRVKDIPVLYLPYISFPLNDERSSGLLFPSYGSTNEGGYEIATPYYFNLAPNYDATVTPRLMMERGLMLSLEARHLGEVSENNLELSYLSNDSLYDESTAGLPETQSPPQAERWQVNYMANSNFYKNWNAVADYSAISDIDYYQDFGNNGLHDTSRSYLYRHGQINYQQNDWGFQAAVQSYQLIDQTLNSLNKPYSSLPRINLNYNTATDSGWFYGLNSEYVYFDRGLDQNMLSQTQINNGALLNGQRMSLEPSLGWSWETPAAYFKPEAKYKYASYQLDQQALGSTATPERGILVSKIDSGLVFDRDLNFKDSNYTQTLEPRLFYLNSEYEDQSNIPLFDTADLTSGFRQLFREDRFSGKDRIGDANQLTLALSSRILDSSGREKAQISVGQIFYFEDRRVNLGAMPGPSQQSNSALAGQFSYQVMENWRFTAQQEWDQDNNELESGNFQFSYQSDINHILNFGYRYRNSVNIPGLIKQTDISGLWPLTDNLGFIGRWNYDHANQRDLETIIGLEYSNCCWDMRLIARKWVDNSDLSGTFTDTNSGIFLQFELKGLGNVLGGSIDSLIGESITGFKSYVENQ